MWVERESSMGGSTLTRPFGTQAGEIRAKY